MRSSAVVFFVASLASAATILKRQTDANTVAPACAQTCYTNTPATPCRDNTDTMCLCLSPTYIQAVSTCVQSACSPEDYQATLTAAQASCKQVGIDWQNPANSLPACAATCDLNTGSTVCPAPADPSTGTIPDFACYCKDTTYVQTMNTCFNSLCTGQDLTTAQNLGSALCRAYGVDLSSTIPATA